MDPISNITSSLSEWLFASPKADPALRGSGTSSFADLLPQAQAALVIRGPDRTAEASATRGLDAGKPNGDDRSDDSSRSDDPSELSTSDSESAEQDFEPTDEADSRAGSFNDTRTPPTDFVPGDETDEDEASIGTRIRLDSDAPAVPDAFTANITVESEIVRPATETATREIAQAPLRVPEPRTNSGASDRSDIVAKDRPRDSARSIERATRAYTASAYTASTAPPRADLPTGAPEAEVPAPQLHRTRTDPFPVDRTFAPSNERPTLDRAPATATPRVDPIPADAPATRATPAPDRTLANPRARTGIEGTSPDATVRTATDRPVVSAPPRAAIDPIAQSGSVTADTTLVNASKAPALERSSARIPAANEPRSNAASTTAGTSPVRSPQIPDLPTVPRTPPVPTSSPRGDASTAPTEAPTPERSLSIGAKDVDRSVADRVRPIDIRYARSTAQAGILESASAIRSTPTPPAEASIAVPASSAAPTIDRSSFEPAVREGHAARDRATLADIERPNGAVDGRAAARTSDATMNSDTTNHDRSPGSAARETPFAPPPGATRTSPPSAANGSANGSAHGTPYPPAGSEALAAGSSSFEPLQRGAADRPAPFPTFESPRSADTKHDASVLRQIQGRFDPSRSEIRLRLTPEHLGEVRMNVRLVDGRVHVEIDAEQATTRLLLDRNLPELRETLARAGVSIDDVRLTTNDDSSRTRSAPTASALHPESSDTTSTRDDAPPEDGRPQPGSHESRRSTSRFTLEDDAEDASTPDSIDAANETPARPLGAGIGTRLNLVV